MTTTTNLKLKKPDQTDGINIADINGNMDTLDGAVKGLQDKFTTDGKAVNADKLDGKDSTEFAASDHTHTPEQAGAAPSNHNHNGVYSLAAHNHSGTYEPANGAIMKTNVQANMSQAIIAGGAQAIGTAQMRNIHAGTTDIGVGAGLATGTIYFVYE